MTIYQLIPDPQALLALEPEELAGIILEYLNSLSGYQAKSMLDRHNFGPEHVASEYPAKYRKEIREALMEGWVWLEREGLLAPRSGSGNGLFFITRRGKRLKRASDVDAYRKSNLLPSKVLHPVIAQKVWATFLRGDYDTAAFQAFKEVEVAVREACSFSAEILGTDLMRKAFDSKAGPLRDSKAPAAEREALAHLFAGAIGSYKNPHSHRRVVISPEEAVEMIMLASHLLKIVDSRSGEPNGG